MECKKSRHARPPAHKWPQVEVQRLAASAPRLHQVTARLLTCRTYASHLSSQASMGATSASSSPSRWWLSLPILTPRKSFCGSAAAGDQRTGALHPAWALLQQAVARHMHASKSWRS